MWRKSQSLLLLLSITTVSTAAICGLVGIHNPDALDLYMGNFFYNGPSNFALCAAWCKNDPTRCRSFRYSYYGDSNSQYCEFFDGALEGNVTPDSSQPFFYYDVACGFPDFVPASTVTSTTTVGDGGAAAPAQTITTTQFQVITETQMQITTTTTTATATTTTTTTQNAAPAPAQQTLTETVGRRTVTVQRRVTAFVTRSATRTRTEFRTITRRV
ncbi:hypothetical protein J1614_003194 [Plenodomus biglobosus]|nr:hypothetical protein J1614_003194 [Plenodomus biglobosus]